MSTTEDDIRASMGALESGAEAGSIIETVPDPAPADDGQPAVARDEHGRFASREAPGAPPAVDPATGTGQPASGAPAVAPDAPGAAGQPAVQPTAESGIFDHTKPPSGWTADMKAKWDSVPEDVRKEITRREEASYQGFEKFRKQMEPAQQVFEAVSQHGDYLAQIQREPAGYISDLMETERFLTTGNPVQKLEKLLEVADTYGVPLRQIMDKSMGGQLAALIAEGHQNYKTPPAVPPEIMRELNQLRAQQTSAQQAAFEAELEGMRANTAEFPLLQEAFDGMHDALEKGRASTFKEAYEYAVWTNPDLRAKAITAVAPAQPASQLQQRQAAAASASAPRPAALGNTNRQDQGDASTEDDIRAAILAAQSAGRA